MWIFSITVLRFSPRSRLQKSPFGTVHVQNFLNRKNRWSLYEFSQRQPVKGRWRWVFSSPSISYPTSRVRSVGPPNKSSISDKIKSGPVRDGTTVPTLRNIDLRHLSFNRVRPLLTRHLEAPGVLPTKIQRQ